MFTTLIIAAICAVGGAAARHLWPARAATVDAVLRDIGADAMRAALKRYPDETPAAYAAAVAGAERALAMLGVRKTPAVLNVIGQGVLDVLGPVLAERATAAAARTRAKVDSLGGV